MRSSTELGHWPPAMRARPPGALGSALVEVLAQAECPALTSRRARRAERSGAPQDPIVWCEAVGSNVVDADGNVYVDLTAGFGVAALGHRHPAVVEAVREQSGRLLHALGDLQPSDVKIELLERLSGLGLFPDTRVILGSHGADAIEAALKTAMLATKRPGVLAFEGGYHGLSHGPLSICGYQPAFRAPFAAQLSPHVVFAPYPRASDPLSLAIARVRDAYREGGVPIGAIVVEPMLGRGGVLSPPAGFLAALSDLADELGALLVLDEIYTGLHRTGPRFALEAEPGVEPDLVCLGKALGGGLPVSACLGSAELLACWGEPGGEAIHTATFFGHPLACAAALASLDVMEELDLAPKVEALGEWLKGLLAARLEGSELVVDVRGRGLSLGVELTTGAHTLRVMRRLLERGYLVVPAAPDASVLQLAPPLVIERPLLEGFVDALAACLEDERAGAAP
jgi:4-aminobutyrate aminotransferase/(S)-3-amino-2-methylpropionate transaminase